MANPDRIRKNRDLIPISVIVCRDPVRNTMIQENTSTTAVRSAVMTSESMDLVPHFARIAVSPAKRAERTAIMSHIDSSFLQIRETVSEYDLPVFV